MIEEGKTRGIIEPERLADMVAFIGTVREFAQLSETPNFGFHPLTGDRRGRYAMTITRNWRLTFTKVDEHTIADLDLEDYH